MREKTALVVLWHDHPELWRGYAELAACGGWDELVVIDSGSTAENLGFLVEAIQAFGPRARVFSYPENECLLAINAGVETVQSDRMVFTTNDLTLLDEHWFAWVTEDSRPGVIQGPWYAEMHDVGFIGGVTCIWLEDWRRLGGYDTGYLSPGYWSDVDLCFRAQELGMELKQTRRGVHHIGGVTTNGTPGAEMERRWEVNRQRFMVRVVNSRGRHD